MGPLCLIAVIITAVSIWYHYFTKDGRERYRNIKYVRRKIFKMQKPWMKICSFITIAIVILSFTFKAKYPDLLWVDQFFKFAMGLLILNVIVINSNYFKVLRKLKENNEDKAPPKWNSILSKWWW